MRDTLQRFKVSLLSGDPLLRALTSFKQWVVPLAEGTDPRSGAPQPRVFPADNGSWWRIFSDTAALHDSLGDQPGLFLSVAGWWVFGNLPDGLAGVELDREEVHAVHFKQHQFAMLRQWSDTVRVERLLQGQNEPEGFPLLHRFDGYRMVVHMVGQRSQMVLAPDSKGRKLAAVFTAPDTLKAFLDGPFADLHEPQPRVLTLSGGQLFQQLASMPLDGIVFNCAGPVRPKAVAPAFSQVVLSQGKPG